MRHAKTICLGLLTIYTLALLYAELRFSQDYVRLFFADIEGPIPFYGVNTTLSAALLWATALVFVINRMFVDKEEGQARARLFYASQIPVFLYLGIDDRFRLHEWVDHVVPHGETLVLLGVAVVEAFLLIYLGELKNRSRRVKLYICVGAVLSAVMLFIDFFLPYELVLRLSCEDLSKIWAGVFLLLFALEICKTHIAQLKSRATPGTVEPR